MEKLEIPYFAEKKDLFRFLVDNKAQLEAQKKYSMKEGDGVFFANTIVTPKGEAIKANIPLVEIPDEYKIRAIINTTNLVDSHMDLHLPGLWKKSLSENKMIMHIQEHIRGFQYIIAEGEDLKAYTKTYSWKELGADYEGTTEALVFDSVIKRAGKKPRNEYMYEQYSNGYVKNHSVGMQYVKMVLCINQPDDPYYGAEFEAWEKYFPEVANQEYALERGFFWAIKEAKVIEGSAVILGSNVVTPTLENNLKSIATEPGDHSTVEPSADTQDSVYKYLIDNFKL